MSLAKEEQEILKQLGDIQKGDEEAENLKTSEEVLEEAQEEIADEQEEEEVEQEEVDEIEEGEEEELEDDLEPQEELTGAKFRHKLKAEKEARDKAERELQAMKERLARLEGRAEATAQVPEAQEPVEEVPDPEYEPEKYAIYKASQLEKQVEQMKLEQEKLSAERQWDNMQSEYSKTNPSYNEAKEFLLKQEAEKIKVLYPSASDAQISQHLKEQEYITAGNAARAGLDPLQHIEFLAFQAGYRPGEKKEEAESPSPKKKVNIKNIKKNAKKNASLIGGTSEGDMGEGRTAEQLANMSLQEIEKFGRQNYESAIKKLGDRLG